MQYFMFIKKDIRMYLGICLYFQKETIEMVSYMRQGNEVKDEGL